MSKRVAVIGGGAAGFFLAVNLMEMRPDTQITIFEAASKPLRKVRVSGGGRCNCTNSFASVDSLSEVYPRGSRLMQRLMHRFSHEDAYSWWESHGVPLVTLPDNCVFPKADDSAAIIDCLMSLARRYGVRIQYNTRISDLDDLDGFDVVCITSGGQPRLEGLRWLERLGHRIEPPVPSLFPLTILDSSLRSLMGIVHPVELRLAGTRLRAEGDMLITHWGISGPATLRLSSYGARYLNENGYKATLLVNWVGMGPDETYQVLEESVKTHTARLVGNIQPFSMPSALWCHLLSRAGVVANQVQCAQIGSKILRRLTEIMVNDTYAIEGRAASREEFVTCGGVSLKSVNPQTLESKVRPGLYFAGEVLDVDGVTGGFNFQAAWTTAFTVASAIAGM